MEGIGALSRLRKPTRWFPALLVLAVLFVYLRGGPWDFVAGDDLIYLAGNAQLKAGLTMDGLRWAFGATPSGGWSPMTWVIHMTLASLFGQSPAAHWYFNLILHLVNSLLLLHILRRATGSYWRSALVATLFAVHPVNVEAVAFQENLDTAMLFFLLLAWLAYLRYSRRPGVGTFLPVAICFALGLMTKPIAVTFPCLLLLVDWWPLGRLGLGGIAPGDPGERAVIGPVRAIAEKLPLFALSFGVGLATWLGGTSAAQQLYPLAVRIPSALATMLDYLSVLVWPSGLSVFYPHPATTLPAWKAPLAAGVILGLTILAVWQRRRRYLLAGWLWFLVVLFPTLGIMQLKTGFTIRADRYLYLAALGVFSATVWGLADFADGGPLRRAVRAACVLIILVALMAAARVQASYWRSTPALYEHALVVAPPNSVAHLNLGMYWERHGDAAKSREHYAAADKTTVYSAEERVGRGTKLAEHGMYLQAEEEFRKALESEPRSARAHSQYGVMLMKQEKLDDALAHLRLAVESDAAYSNGWINLGVLYDRLGRAREAIEAMRKASALQPRDANTHYNLALLLLKSGDREAALGEARLVAEIDPDLGARLKQAFVPGGPRP